MTDPERATSAAAWLARTEAALPPEIDPAYLRGLPEYAGLDDGEAIFRHLRVDREAGAPANRLTNREALTAFFADAPGIVEIAESAAHATFPQAEVVTPSNLAGRSTRGPKAVLVVASHMLPHAPNPLGLFRAVSDLLLPGGLCLLMIPDKRYGFEHFMPLATVGSVVAADAEGRIGGALQAFIDQHLLKTHSDSRRHWAGDHGVPHGAEPALYPEFARTYARLDGEQRRRIRSWSFTPESFRQLAWALSASGLMPLEPLRVYWTLHVANEFWAVLRKPAMRRRVDGLVTTLPDLTDRSDAAARARTVVAAPAGPPELPPWTTADSPGETAEELETRLAASEALPPDSTPLLQSRLAPPASLMRSRPGHHRVLVSFRERSPHQPLLGVVCTDPLCFQAVALPSDVGSSFRGANGLAMNGRHVFAALEVPGSSYLLTLNREDLSFAGLHVLEGTYDPHSILLRDDWLYVASTGTDEVLRYPLSDGVPGAPEAVWRPDDSGRRADHHHLNGLCADAEGLIVCGIDLRGRFSASPRPQKLDGFIARIPQGTVLHDGLAFPHTPFLLDGRLAWLQSPKARLTVEDGRETQPLFGWARGACIAGEWLVVGTSAGRSGRASANTARYAGCTVTRLDPSTLTRNAALDLSYWGAGIYELLALDSQPASPAGAARP